MLEFVTVVARAWTCAPTLRRGSFLDAMLHDTCGSRRIEYFLLKADGPWSTHFVIAPFQVLKRAK